MKFSQALGLAVLLCPVLALGAPVIVAVESAAPGVVDLQLQSQSLESGQGTVPTQIDTSPASYRVDDQQPSAVSRWSLPYDSDRAITTQSPNLFPVTVRDHIFLRISQPLQSGSTHQITSPYGNTSFTFTDAGTHCTALKTNQAGYSGLATSRFATFGVWLGSGGSMRFSQPVAYQVIHEASGSVVFSGTSSREFDDTAIGPVGSGEWVYRLPLSQVPVGGPYRVVVPGCGASRSFGIGDSFFRQASYVATRGLYHQRCGIALERPYTEHTRAVCHTQVADTRAPWPGAGFIQVPTGMATFPIRGGHHDAADADRRPLHTVIAHLLLNYYEGFPDRFSDRQYNIPESGNGIPDFLDEALWSVLLWENLQVSTPGDTQLGGVRAGTEQAHHPTMGVHSMANDPGIYGTWGVLEDVTAMSAGLFAQSSRLVRQYDSAHADSLLNRAQLAWAYLARTTDVNATRCYLLYASLQLYLATGDQSQHDRFRRLATAIVVNGGSWPEQFLPGNISAACQAAHFVGYLLPHGQPTDAALVAALKARIASAATSGGYMSVNTESSPYSQGANRFLDWGALTAQGRYADVYVWDSLLTTDPARRQQDINTVSQLADYALGLNPLSMSFYTGIGTDQPRSPLHLDSFWTKYGLSDGVTTDHVGHPIGNVPGILIYGPTGGRSGAGYQVAGTGKLFPGWDALPIQRHWGDAWHIVNSAEFATWETIAWNVPMLAFLAGPVALPPPTIDAGTVDASMADSAADVADSMADTVVTVDAADAGADAATDVVVVRDVVTVVDSGGVDAGAQRCINIAPVCITVAPVCWQ